MYVFLFSCAFSSPEWDELLFYATTEVRNSVFKHAREITLNYTDLCIRQKNELEQMGISSYVDIKECLLNRAINNISNKTKEMLDKLISDNYLEKGVVLSTITNYVYSKLLDNRYINFKDVFYGRCVLNLPLEATISFIEFVCFVNSLDPKQDDYFLRIYGRGSEIIEALKNFHDYFYTDLCAYSDSGEYYPQMIERRTDAALQDYNNLRQRNQKAKFKCTIL